MLNITSAVHGFWPAHEFVDLADEPTGCGEVCLEIQCDKVLCTNRGGEKD